MLQSVPKLPQMTLHEKKGKLSSELILRPGHFGLGIVPKKKKPDRTTNMICGFCSTGCSLKVHIKNGEAVNLTPTSKYPVNLGMACPKGWEALTPLYSEDRATQPLLINKSGELAPISWHKALSEFTQNFKAVQRKYGMESVAFISTGQIPTEEMAYLGALAKFGMGLTHGDGNTRQCMATSVVAYKESFGFDSPPYTYQDFEESDTVVLIGSNLCIAHPIMWQRVMRNKNNPEIIVVDPRRTETAMASTQHYAITPKSDLKFLYAIAHALIEKNWIDPEFIKNSTVGFQEFKAFLKNYSPESVSHDCGITVKNIYHLAKTIHKGKKVSLWWTMGVNQSYEGVRTAQAIINLALMTGNIGRPGTGANSITGQCNAMGSRLFSNTTGLLGGHSFENPEHRKKVASILEIDPSLIPQKPSWPYHKIIEGIESGKIKGLWILATNTAHSWIHQNQFTDLRKKLDFLVVQDMYPNTETARIADLVLPAAGWGEKEGTFINSERRIACIKQVKKAPGQALSDFRIFKLISEYWGCSELFKKWKSPEDTFKILTQLTKDQPCDITSIKDYKQIDSLGGIQWPYNKNTPHDDPQRRLFEDGKFFHSDQKAKFIFEKPKPLAEAIINNFPFQMLTGRGTSSQWHTQTRTSKSEILKKLYPKDVYFEINPEDAKKLEIKNNEWVEVYSKRAVIKARAFYTYIVKSGQIFMPMHYPHVNKLTHPSYDPYSHQPSYKACAVNIRKIN